MEDVPLRVSRAEFERLEKTLMARLSDIEGRLGTVKAASETSGQYCRECETYTKDLYEHLKKNPEKHGLVREVPKEVVKRRSVTAILAEHDIFECPDCRRQIDEHLSGRGLEISKRKEAGKTDFLGFPQVEL